MPNPAPSRLSTIPGMPTLVEAWDAAIAAEPDDWSHATVELTLDDAERMEEAALLDRAAPTRGTARPGAAACCASGSPAPSATAPARSSTRGLLRRLDGAGISGRLRIVSSLDAVLPVSTQGPTF